MTCPDCRMPSQVGDESAKYMCSSCFAEIIFETCGECGFHQSIPSRWSNAFTCGKCSEKVEIPRVRIYSTSTKAKDVTGYGFTYPRM